MQTYLLHCRAPPVLTEQGQRDLLADGVWVLEAAHHVHLHHAHGHALAAVAQAAQLLHALGLWEGGRSVGLE